MICIVCPNGCKLSVETTIDGLKVIGQKCKRGIDFARSEVENPMRTISTTIATTSDEFPVLPVRTNGEIPKNKIFDVMKETRKVKVEKAKLGDVIIENVCGLGVDIIAISNIINKIK